MFNIKFKNTQSMMVIVIGVLFLLFGIYLSIIQNDPHYFTFFSIGMLIVTLKFYNAVAQVKLFERWRGRHVFLFTGFLVGISIVIDQLGLFFGYWSYPYTTFLDEIFKYAFEWAAPFAYLMITLFIGIEFFKKVTKNKHSIFVLSLLIFVTPTGLFTEYINTFTYSWRILEMPLINAKIGPFFLLFQTVGYWTMAILTFFAYTQIDKRVKKHWWEFWK